MLIDSHCHLHDREFFTEEQATEMLTRAHKNGVQKIICIGTSHADSLAARDFAAAHDDVYWTYGIHPSEAGTIGDSFSFLETVSRTAYEPFEVSSARDDGPERTRSIEKKNIASRPVAIGEVGLDYHYAGYDRDAQIKLFEQMLQLAKDNNLPLSFHVREAFDDFFAVVKNFPESKGVVHSFSDNKKNLKRILNETSFYVGVNGMATYSTLPTPPLERILLETDAPFLTPKPFRGIINEPGYIPEIAKWLSEKLALDYKIIEEETTKNVRKLFRI